MAPPFHQLDFHGMSHQAKKDCMKRLLQNHLADCHLNQTTDPAAVLTCFVEQNSVIENHCCWAARIQSQQLLSQRLSLSRSDHRQVLEIGSNCWTQEIQAVEQGMGWWAAFRNLIAPHCLHRSNYSLERRVSLSCHSPSLMGDILSRHSKNCLDSLILSIRQIAPYKPT